jgi:hypothetical protein
MCGIAFAIVRSAAVHHEVACACRHGRSHAAVLASWFFGNPNSVEGELRDLECDDEKVPLGKKPANAMSQSKHLPLKCGRVHVEDVDGDDVRSELLQPASRGRTKNIGPNGEVEITCGLDQLTQSMIALLLNSNGC